MKTATTLPFQVDRAVIIHATPEIVFRFFTDSVYWARWWGPGSTVDPRPGGRVLIRFPGGNEASGEVVEVLAPERIVFTYGYVNGQLISWDGSRVTIRLEPVADGTRVRLTHEVVDEAARDAHVQGWRYQMAVFSVAVAELVNAGATDAVDAWFQAWSASDAGASERTLTEIAVPDVTFRDVFSNITGIADLLPHLAAARTFMPGIVLKRAGGVRHCQGTALADWVAVAADGAERSRGTNVFVFGPTGKIESVTGLWASHPGSAG
jgi:uncharacterized protein YndB with AHSA1/START domain